MKQYFYHSIYLELKLATSVNCLANCPLQDVNPNFAYF